MASSLSFLPSDKLTTLACFLCFLFRGAATEKFSFRNLLQHFNVSALPLNEEERVNFTHMAYGPTFDPHNINFNPRNVQEHLLSNMNILFVSFPRQPGEIYFREVPDDLAVLLDPSAFFRVSSEKHLDNMETQLALRELNLTNFNHDLFSESSLEDTMRSSTSATEPETFFHAQTVMDLNATNHTSINFGISTLMDLLSDANVTRLVPLEIPSISNISATTETPATVTRPPTTATTPPTTSTTTSTSPPTEPPTTSKSTAAETTTKATTTSTVETTTPRDFSMLLEVELLRFENSGSLRSDGRWCHLLWPCSPRVYTDELDTTTPWAEWPRPRIRMTDSGHDWKSPIASYDYRNEIGINRRFSQPMCSKSDGATLRVKISDAGITSNTLINEFACWIPAKFIDGLSYEQWSDRELCAERYPTVPRMRLTFRYRKLRQRSGTQESRCRS